MKNTSQYILARYRNKANGFRGYLWGGTLFDGRGAEAEAAAIRYPSKKDAQKEIDKMSIPFSSLKTSPIHIVLESEI